MKIVIVGAGEIGFFLARQLSSENHDIVLIEIDPEKCAHASDNLDISVIEGSGSSIDILSRAGTADAEVFVAVSNIDEINLIACMIANKLGRAKTVARVRNSEYNLPGSPIKPGDLGIDLMIHPEEEASEEIVRLIRRSEATDVIEYANGQIQLVGLRLEKGAPILGVPLKDFTAKYPEIQFRVAAIYRNSVTIIPRGDQVLSSGDQAFFISRTEMIPEVLKIAGKEDVNLDKVMILGGGKVGRSVAELLEESHDLSIKIIESDTQKSQKLADELSNTLVLNADGTDLDLMVTEGVMDMDCFVSTTNDDESNLVTSLLAKHLGVKRAIVLINKSIYMPIIPSIGVDAAVSRMQTTIDAILRYIRRGNIISVSTLKGIEAEVIEMVAEEKSKITKKPIKDLDIPDGAIIGSVITPYNAYISTGDSCIQAGDKVINIAIPSAISKLESIFSRR